MERRKNENCIFHLVWSTLKEVNVAYDTTNPFQPLECWRINIHNSDELPSSYDFQLFQGLRSLFNVFIIPELQLIDDDLKSWCPARRSYLDGEKNLIFFKKYTKKNCEHECLSFEILEACKCVPFYVIREFKLYPTSRLCQEFDYFWRSRHKHLRSQR